MMTKKRLIVILLFVEIALLLAMIWWSVK